MELISAQSLRQGILGRYLGLYIWRNLVVGMPRKRPRDKFGTSQGHPGRLGRSSMWRFIFKGQNVRGTDGTYDRTDGTCPRDRRDTHQGVFFFFLFPHVLLDRTEKHKNKDMAKASLNTYLFVCLNHTHSQKQAKTWGSSSSCYVYLSLSFQHL